MAWFEGLTNININTVKFFGLPIVLFPCGQDSELCWVSSGWITNPSLSEFGGS